MDGPDFVKNGVIKAEKIVDISFRVNPNLINES